MITREPFIVKDLYCSPFQLLAGRHSSNILHPASLHVKRTFKKQLSVWQFWHLNIGNVPWTVGEIFSFYWQKKIFGQFATLEAVKSREKFTPSLCQPHWPQDPDSQIRALKISVFILLLGKWKNVSLINVGGAATGATLGLLWGLWLSWQLWQIKIPANCPVIVLTCENCDWVLNWNLHTPHGEAVNNIEHLSQQSAPLMELLTLTMTLRC